MDSLRGRRAGRGQPLLWGRPLAIVLIVLEKACSVVGVAAGAAFAGVMLVRGATNPLPMLLPREWAEAPRDAWMRWLAHHVPPISPGTAALVAGGLGVWAALLAAEAIGLWLDLGWGEFLVILEAAVFLPPEAWHLARRPAGGPAATLAANVLVAMYVAALYRRRLRARGGWGVPCGPRIGHDAQAAAGDGPKIGRGVGTDPPA